MRNIDQIAETGVAWCTEEEFSHLLARVKELEQIETKHKIINGQLREELRKYDEQRREHEFTFYG